MFSEISMVFNRILYYYKGIGFHSWTVQFGPLHYHVMLLNVCTIQYKLCTILNLVIDHISPSL